MSSFPNFPTINKKIYVAFHPEIIHKNVQIERHNTLDQRTSFIIHKNMIYAHCSFSVGVFKVVCHRKDPELWEAVNTPSIRSVFCDAKKKNVYPLCQLCETHLRVACILVAIQPCHKERCALSPRHLQCGGHGLVEYSGEPCGSISITDIPLFLPIYVLKTLLSTSPI